MALAPKRLAGPVNLTASAATLLTATAAKTTVIRSIRVVNIGAAPQTFRLSIGSDATGTRIIHDFEVPVGDAYKEFMYEVLAAGETLQGYASVTGYLTITVNGTEE